MLLAVLLEALIPDHDGVATTVLDERFNLRAVVKKRHATTYN